MGGGSLPAYLPEGRLVLLSKTGSSSAPVDDSRPIVVLSHISKILEKALQAQRSRKQTSLDRNILNWFQGRFNDTYELEKSFGFNIEYTKEEDDEKKIFVCRFFKSL